MGTVVNGNIWSGACVAGKEITGLVKNGVVFYKREIPTPSVYKRRIMVGDSLNSKILYITLPTDFVVQNNETIIETDTYNAIEKTTNSADTGTPNVDLCYVSSEFTVVGLIGKTQYEIPSDFGTVTSIIDTDDAYRHLYIEDPNIRPLRVGDIVVSNTKFYFNVPDDFRSELPSTYTPGIQDIIILNKNDLVQKMRINYTLNIYDRCSIEYMKKSSNGSSWSSRTDATIFDLKQEKNLSTVFAGDMDLLEASGFVGTITEINTASPAYKYVLVDTTTLGA